ncbi:hypothetical protein ZP73_004340, partial [Salmonella enterica subsp. enterica]|nr:hypothetical protein [Salmonella enterica subsp. enterica serovar Bovismorbificans]EDQ3656165.1 hypothetical protein [Salmonella enterica subsp. enterica]EDX9929673.1 hypothetical protein [Salmonella enterica]EEF6679248.1 hypothetical protein [Salmonella enterica subsp. enterica serovar Mississippi]EEK8244418.1 hypothetical protein [Salmonella enterica subsp. enterica serovar Newport]HAE3891816.1 hypothetical protein [Salmonella enterica subsp. enterica serovar Java]
SFSRCLNSFVNKFDVTLITLFTLPDIYREAHINTARAIAMGAIIKELL